MECSPPGSSVHGILQARILEWAAISSSEDLPNLRIEPVSHISCIDKWILLPLDTLEAPYFSVILGKYIYS